MTDKKISELTSITGANVSDANDVLPIVDTSVATTKKITRAELFKSVSSVDINGGTIDGTVIGGSTPAAISGTTGTFSGDVSIADKIVHTGDTNTALRFPAADTVTVETAGSERMRIDNSGNVLVGTTVLAGDASNTAVILNGGTRTASGNLSIVTAVATTIFSITGGNRGRYEIVAMIASSGDAAIYSAVSTVLWDGSTGRAISNDGTGLTITLSGSDVKVTQTAGSTQTVYWSFQRIAL